MESHVFGPVPSRRLGMSLGVDSLPAKTCTFNCIYCQVGRTTTHTNRRQVFLKTRDIVKEIRSALRKNRKVDYITFSGSGEPTLASNLGRMIRAVKRLTSIPVAVITNSSLLARRSVVRDLMPVDVLMPSLDAATEPVFRKLNRPFRGIKAADMINALAKFREKFGGQIWLEVMLVRRVNDMPSETAALREAIARIRPDKIQLNTVVRPPCEKWARPLSQAALERISRRIADDIPVEIIVPFKGKLGEHARATQEEVLAMLKRRSCTAKDISSSHGINLAEAIKHVELLVATGKAQAMRHRNQVYYLATSKQKGLTP